MIHKMKVSLVVIEYYSLDEIGEYIKRLSDYSDIELIVSSNSLYSTEEQKNIVLNYPQCQWQFNERNGGFAYAMNRGLSRATGDVLIISNPDCNIQYGLYEMAEFLCMHSEIGAIAPQIVDDDNNIQDSCRPYVTLPSFVMRQIRRIIFKKESVLNKKFDYDAIQTVDWVIGAFIMVTRKAYEKTHGLCDDYFMYAEDLDWCTRIRRSGLEIVYYPAAKVIYKGTRSARSTWKYMKIFLKSHFLYWQRFGFFIIKPKRSMIRYFQ